MDIKKVVEGQHRGASFRYENGFLTMFNIKWDKTDIKTLVEAANLLELQGYKLKECIEVKQRKTMDIYGFTRTKTYKVYDDQPGFSENEE